MLSLLVFGFAGLPTGADTLHADLRKARATYSADVERYARSAYHIVRKAVDTKSWPSLRTSLKKQGFSIRERPSGWGNGDAHIGAPDLNFALADGSVMKLEIRLDVRAAISATKPTTMKSSLTWARLVAEPKVDLPQFAQRRPFQPESVPGKVLARPGLAKVAQIYPRVTSFAIRYGPMGRPLSMESPRFMPYVLTVELELERVKGGFSQEVGLDYYAPSRLDPHVSWDGTHAERTPTGPPSFGEVRPQDDGEARALRADHSWTRQSGNDGFLWMVNHAPTEDWGWGRLDPPGAAYSLPDLLALPTSTQRLELYSENLDRKGWQTLLRLRSLRVLDINGTPNPKVTEDDLAHVAKLPRLEELYIRADMVGDWLARALSGHPRLTQVNIAGKRLTDKGLIALTHLPSLKRLHIGWCRSATDRWLEEVAKVHGLKELSLPGEGKFTDGGLRKLAKLTSLEFIGIDGAKGVKPGSLRFVGNLRALKGISLDNCNVDARLLAAIGKLPDVDQIDMRNVRGLTDQALLSLAGMKKLEVLQISDCPGVTLAGIEALRKKMPRRFWTPATPVDTN